MKTKQRRNTSAKSPETKGKGAEEFKRFAKGAPSVNRRTSPLWGVRDAIETLREKGWSYARIAEELRGHGIVVSRPRLASWHKRLRETEAPTKRIK